MPRGATDAIIIWNAIEFKVDGSVGRSRSLVGNGQSKWAMEASIDQSGANANVID